MNIFKRVDNLLGDMGPWYLAALMSLIFGLLVIYLKTGKLW